MAMLPALRTGCFYPSKGKQMVLIPVRDWVDPRARLRPDGL